MKTLLRHTLYILALSLAIPLQLLGAGPDVPVSDTPKEYFDLMGRADKAIKEGKWADAEEKLRQALRLDPSNPSNILLLSNLGMVQFYDGRTNDAITTLTDAHRIAPASVTILLNRARVFTSAGMEEAALTDYSEVIALDSTLAEPRFYRAMIELNRGNSSGACADIDTLAARHPDDRFTHIGLATLLMHQGKYADAIPHLSSVVKDEPDPSYLGSRALCYLLTDDPAAASDDISRALELDPTDGELYLYRAMLNKLRFRPDDARADGEKAIRFGVSPERVRMLLK